ncbi:MAG: hypothetical protein V8S83_05830 [Oscillospiraceae bacterium]
MKRFFIWITAVVMALSCVTVAFAAGYSKLDNLTPGQVGYVLGQLLTEKTGNYVYDVPWYADSYDYRVIVSYDSLSELCSTANGLGMTCSVRWNHNAKLYVISVDDYTTFELSSTHGVIGNPDGYIYAAYDESEQGIWNNYGIGQWGVYADYSSTSVFREVSYATLSELCANLNEKGIPCYIASTSAWGSSTYWYIRGSGTVVYQPRYDAPSTSYSITNHVYLDIAAAPLVARYNPESTLSSCLSRLTSIQTNVTTIKNNLVNTIGSNLESLLTTCNTISTKLDTLTSVISNGKVLVDSSDVVSAIQSIPAFDDTELLSGLSALGATTTRIADAIDYNFGQYSGTHTFPSLDKRQFYVYGDKAELFEDISGNVLYSSSEMLSTFSYTRDYDGMTRTLYVRAYPTCAQYSLELLSDTRPTAPITISKIEYNTLLGSPRYRDSIVYPVAWRYSSVANKYYAVTGFTVYYKDDPEQYPVSTTASAFENPYVYGFDSKPVDVVFSSRFTAFQQLENTRLINALSGRDYTSQLTAVVEKLDALANKSAVDLTTIESTLSTISDKLDNTASDVNNTIINITNDNDYFSVFYITDGDGNTQSVTDFAGALTGASGKLLSLLYRLVFADALGSVDGDLGNMEDFFTSEEPPLATAAMNGETAPANEVIDVWAS